MTPRNNSASSTFKKGNNEDVDVNQMVPCILHKKHRAVRLIREHLEDVCQVGIFTNLPGSVEEVEVESIHPARLRHGEEVDMELGETWSWRRVLLMLFLIPLLLLGLILLIIWISSGPLSNTIPHTPIMCSSFIRTECLCSLEKKYLLRWSKPEYFE